jgi:hypothetical protein
VELAYGVAVVHGVEGGNLVDAHWGHFEETSNLVHDANAGKSVLTLAEIEDGHDGGLLVLGRITLQDLGNDLLILGVELERDIGVVLGGVSVLAEGSSLAGLQSGSSAAPDRRSAWASQANGPLHKDAHDPELEGGRREQTDVPH